MELFGEGLFLVFDENALDTWQNQPSVEQRTEILRLRALDAGLIVPNPVS